MEHPSRLGNSPKKKKFLDLKLDLDRSQSLFNRSSSRTLSTCFLKICHLVFELKNKPEAEVNVTTTFILSSNYDALRTPSSPQWTTTTGGRSRLGHLHPFLTHEDPFGVRRRRTRVSCTCNVKPSASVSDELNGWRVGKWVGRGSWVPPSGPESTYPQ